MLFYILESLLEKQEEGNFEQKVKPLILEKYELLLLLTWTKLILLINLYNININMKVFMADLNKAAEDNGFRYFDKINQIFNLYFVIH